MNRPDGSCLFEEKPMNFLAPDGTMPASPLLVTVRIGLPAAGRVR